MLLFFQENRLISLRRMLRPLVLIGLSSLAQANEDERPITSKWSYQIGVDSWRLDPSVSQDSDPGFSEENTNLLLPNAATTWDYKSVSPFIAVSGNTQLTKNTGFSFKARANQTLGMRLDDASFHYNLSPFLGARLGVVNYKTSWCRSYEPDNGWMRELEAICVTPQFLDVTGGAPGAQIFTSNTWGDYLVQGQVGLYRPLKFNYAPKEYGNLIPSKGFEVQSNRKLGFNINVLNLQTAVETRLSYIKADQSGYLPESDLKGVSKQTSDMWYWAIGSPVTSKLNIRLTQLLQTQQSDCRSDIAAMGSACNLDLELLKNSTAIELAYRIDVVNLLSFGVSRTRFDLSQDFYTPSRDQHVKAKPFFINTQQVAAAWRHDWGDGLFSIVQVIQSNQKNGSAGQNFASHGNAIGLRLGYQY